MNDVLKLVQEFFRVIPEEVNNISLKNILRFYTLIEIQEETECWDWMGPCDSGGYGAFRYKGKQEVASRFSWQIHFGKIPEGLWVCHRCDRPVCVSPHHLFLGTPRENAMDSVNKGRHHRAKKN